MKRLVLFLLPLFVGLLANSQETVKERKVPTTYDRSSLTVLYVDFNSGGNWNQAKPKIESVVFGDKFDNNNIETLFLKPSFSRDAITISGAQAIKSLTPSIKGLLRPDGIPKRDMLDPLLKELVRIDAGRKIIAKWYNRKPDGSMDMELVHQRGRFTAVDDDYLRAQTSRRGSAALEDYGNRLLNLSFILLIDIDEIEPAGEKRRGWKASANSFLYRIDFNDEVRNAFYETWIYDDDSEQIKEQKRRAFDELVIPIIPVIQKSVAISASQLEDIKIKKKSLGELMQELVQKSYDETIYYLEMDVPQFQVVTPLIKTRPLKAKIGLKEGLKTDDRFFVYEYVYDRKTNDVGSKRRGVVRARSSSKIVDNRYEAMGEMEASEFYQVHGRKLQEGFTLHQKNDVGVEVSIGGETGEIGGVFARGDYRLGRFIGIQATFVYVEGGIDGGTYPGASSRLGSNSSFTFLRYGGGIAKGFQLTRNIELRPYIGAGMEQASNSDLTEDEAVSSLYVKPGVNLALNLSHNFQVTTGFGAYAFITDAEDGYGSTFGSWNTLFQDRSGPSLFLGIRIGL